MSKWYSLLMSINDSERSSRNFNQTSTTFMISLNTRTAKIVARILRKRIKRKTEDVLEEDQFGFRRGKGTRDVTGMLRIISE
jgi:hypothetical protein